MSAAGLVAAMAAVGVLVGVAWWWVAPQPTYRVAEDGLYLVGGQPQEYVAADGWFALLTAAVGAVAGLLVWVRRPVAGAAAVWALLVGGLVGSGVAAITGVLLGRADPFAAELGSLTQGPLEIRAYAVLLVEAMLALAVWLALDVLVDRAETEPAPRTPPIDSLAIGSSAPGWSSAVATPATPGGRDGRTDQDLDPSREPPPQQYGLDP